MTFVTADPLFGSFKLSLQTPEIRDNHGFSIHMDEVFSLQAAQVA